MTPRDIPSSTPSPGRTGRWRKRLSRLVIWALVLGAIFVFGEHLRHLAPRDIYLTARPTPANSQLAPGEHELGLGGPRLVNRKIQWRDGLLYIPESATASNAVPLLVWLHSGGGKAGRYRHMFHDANREGVAVLALDARHNTWDAIDSPYGLDVRFIDEALRYTFEHVAIDPKQVALGGHSDGASYALALGRLNGTLFSHLIAVSPGRLAPPAPPQGKPRILVSHGTRDNVYSIIGSRDYIVPELRAAGYDVTFHAYDGTHGLTKPAGAQLLKWFAAKP